MEAEFIPETITGTETYQQQIWCAVLGVKRGRRGQGKGGFEIMRCCRTQE